MRDKRDGFRSKSFYASHYSRDHFPLQREAAPFRESPGGGKDSPNSRSGSSVSSRSYSPEWSRPYAFQQSQNSRESAVQPLETPQGTSTWSSSAVPSNRAPATPLVIDQPREPESNTTEWIELFADGQLNNRSKAIASKMKEIEEVYRQDCENFGIVVKMLIAKDPSLEQTIQFALRQNLQDIDVPKPSKVFLKETKENRQSEPTKSPVKKLTGTIRTVTHFPAIFTSTLHRAKYRIF